jgi:hypothetical protein
MPADVISLREFLPYIWLHVPGAPEITVQTYARMAAIEFCERSRCWRHMVEVTLTDQNHVAVVAPDYAAIHDFEFATFRPVDDAQPRPLTPTQFSDVAPRGFDWQEGGAPQYITQASPNTATIFPFAPGLLSLSVFLKPRFGQDLAHPDRVGPLDDYYNRVPDFLLTQWGEAISSGAIAKLLVVPQQRWTDPKMAAAFLAKFERYCDGAFSSNIKGQHRAPPRARFSYV